MSERNKLLVPGIEKMIRDYKEEIAEEFGTHFSPASRDVITRKLAGEKNKQDGREEEKDESRKKND